jgi:hypothetical protein
LILGNTSLHNIITGACHSNRLLNQLPTRSCNFVVGIPEADANDFSTSNRAKGRLPKGEATWGIKPRESLTASQKNHCPMTTARGSLKDGGDPGQKQPQSSLFRPFEKLRFLWLTNLPCIFFTISKTEIPKWGDTKLGQLTTCASHETPGGALWLVDYSIAGRWALNKLIVVRPLFRPHQGSSPVFELRMPII